MSNLIALYATGPQMGKTTVANHLVDSHGYASVKFAGGLKTLVYTLLRQFKDDPTWAYACIEGDQKEVPLKWLNGKTPRDLMVTMGTDWGRMTIDPNIWVKLAYTRIRTMLEAGQNVVVDDMRFPNEYKTLASLSARFCQIRVANETAPAPSSTEGLLTGEYFEDYISVARGDLVTLRAATDTLARYF